MGVAVPPRFPEDPDINYSDDWPKEGSVDDAIFNNPHASVIYEIFRSLNDVWGFYAAYISELF
ncbi:MAG: XRE family transcriptional regulator, partial [Rhodothermales bacterium]